MHEPLLDIEHLSVSFGEAQVLSHFSLRLNAGEIVGVVGESGSGKSVAAQWAMGLLSRRARTTVSAARLFGVPYHEMDAARWCAVRGNDLAFVFQDPMTALHPSKRIGVQLEEVLRQHTALDAAERTQRCLRALQEVEIDQPEVSMQKYPHQLSGGQQQRIVIAMALLLDPKLIIADEPTTALDKEVEGVVLALLMRLVKERGCAMWFISHDLELVAHIAHRVVVMYQGQTVEQGPADQVFRAPTHPYTRALLQCRPPQSGRPYPLPTLQDLLDGRAPEQGSLPSAKNEELVLELEQVSLGYWQRKGFRKHYKEVIRGLDLHLYKGEVLGLIGPSGSGKSSLGRAIVGLNAFSAKRFTVNGAQRSTEEVRRSVQFIFQDPFGSLNAGRKVGAALADVLAVHQPKLRRVEREQRVASLLEEVGLAASDAQKFPSQFSGGQRQRIGIARALAAEPEILICDESVSALDVSVQSQVLNVLNRIKQQRGLSMIFISHDPDVVRYMCDRVLDLGTLQPALRLP